MTTHMARGWQRSGTRGPRRALAIAAASVGAALVLLALGGVPARADGAWLDGQPLANWNTARAAIPQAPPRDPLVPCPPQGRAPQTDEDRRVAAAGWTLFGAFQGGYGLMVVQGATVFDGMCWPLGFQTFVFFLGEFIGTLSPALMDARSDGAQLDVRISAPLNDGPGPEGLPSLTASFARYAASDPACCPSSTSSLPYTLAHTGTGWVLTPGAVASGATVGL